MLGSNDNNTHADELSNEAIQDTSGVNQNEQSREEPTAETTVDNEGREEPTAETTVDNESEGEPAAETTVDNEGREEPTAETTVDNESEGKPTAETIVDNGSGGKLPEKLTTVNVEKPTEKLITANVGKPTTVDSGKSTTVDVEKPTEKLTTVNVEKPTAKFTVDGGGKVKPPVDEHPCFNHHNLCFKHFHDPYHNNHHAAWYHTHDSGNTVIIPYGWKGGLPVAKVGGHVEFLDLNKPVLIPDVGYNIFDCC